MSRSVDPRGEPLELSPENYEMGLGGTIPQVRCPDLSTREENLSSSPPRITRWGLGEPSPRLDVQICRRPATTRDAPRNAVKEIWRRYAICPPSLDSVELRRDISP